ncbi:uncharacterized protein K452DRAFT_286061 [Aplosporella prunicola CBS 121167]|uniref:Aminoglycoside phosphotransferase domain-containing protein n=1 Tax=Aplosporella prunicola CBS 121167 TaxID=1176127 RepID=A0A6A6BK73_9PEZI|nr:uncharacterized protein K452DRAFT_286061 [Aplosporella prunicola CBS 121167]KAF2143237.1 hypothetical protein K452DRAFT_286061 [Aplosporella prunicola CBS 121167]
MEAARNQVVHHQTSAATAAAERLSAFFSPAARAPPRDRCDDLALYITGLTRVVPTPSQGCHSYTVVCYNDDDDDEHSNTNHTTTSSSASSSSSSYLYADDKPPSTLPSTTTTPCDGHPHPRIVQFRVAGSKLSLRMLRAARIVHGFKVPYTTFEGELGRVPTELPLLVYAMDWIGGATPLQRFSQQRRLSETEAGRLETFAQELGAYFARAWLQPAETLGIKEADEEALAHRRDAVARVLRVGMEAGSPLPARVKALIPGLLAALGTLFSRNGPLRQVLTHGDLNASNLIIDPESFHVNGVVDWASAGVWPFGCELYVLQLLTGFWDDDHGNASTSAPIGITEENPNEAPSNAVASSSATSNTPTTGTASSTSTTTSASTSTSTPLPPHPHPPSSTPTSSPQQPRWRTYATAPRLYALFWHRFFALTHPLAPTPEARHAFLETVRPAWRLGLLLREGFVHAADGGVRGKVVGGGSTEGGAAKAGAGGGNVQLGLLERFLCDDAGIVDAGFDAVGGV